jgi:hypothetical protein
METYSTVEHINDPNFTAKDSKDTNFIVEDGQDDHCTAKDC